MKRILAIIWAGVCVIIAGMETLSDLTDAGTIGNDVLRGADQIAFFLYGEERHRRKVYNLVETNRMPHFHLGSTVCARKSVLITWIKLQERLSTATSSP